MLQKNTAECFKYTLFNIWLLYELIFINIAGKTFWKRLFLACNARSSHGHKVSVPQTHLGSASSSLSPSNSRSNSNSSPLEIPPASLSTSLSESLFILKIICATSSPENLTCGRLLEDAILNLSSCEANTEIYRVVLLANQKQRFWKLAIWLADVQ